MSLLHLVLDQGYAADNRSREDRIPMILLNHVSGMTATGGSFTVSFSSVEAARAAHERTGWPFDSDKTLKVTTAADHITTRPPPFSDCATAFYARWFIQSRRPPPS